MSLFPSLGKRREIKKAIRGKKRIIPCLEVLEGRDLPSTFTVTSTSADASQSGSLAWAVAQSNATAGTNYINFDISGSGVHVINLSAGLGLSHPVVIDGTTQPGYNGTPLISVQGNSNIAVLFYFSPGSSGSTIQGLDMFNYTGNAITTSYGSNGNWIQNNWMGFFQDRNGVHLNSGLGYSYTGDVGIQSSNNTVRNNVMSGVYNAVSLGEDPAGAWSGRVYSGNAITSNLFGTDPTGVTASGYGNQSDAMFLGSGSQANYLGPYNIMSGALHGIEIYAASATGNAIFQNKIGTDITGNHAIPNADGIVMGGGASGNTVGGPLGGNLISGNTGAGINIGVPGFGASNNNTIQNNVFGLNSNQSAAIGAGSFGVSINSGSAGNNVLGNVICAAANNGVYLSGASFNTVTGNWLGENASGVGFANGYFGIAAVQGSNNNNLSGNYFGLNNAGPIYIDGSSIGNNTGGSIGPASIAGQIQQIFQDFAVALQYLQSGNFAGFFQQIQNIISLYINVELEMLNSLLHGG